VNLIDFLIIGQGIAGTIMSNSLMDLGYTVIIIDPGKQNATSVSAGNINPVTGRKFTKSWQIEKILKTCNDIYPKLEEKIGLKVLTKLKIYRPLRKIKDEHQWLSREGDSSYEGYLSHQDKIPELDEFIPPPLMYGIIHQALKLDTSTLIDGYRTYLIKNRAFLQETFDYSSLEINSEFVKYRDITAKNIIFCDGSGLTINPLFNFLPIQPTKGEILHITTDLPKSFNLRDQTFISPESTYFWVGSNHDRTFTNANPTTEQRKNLAHKLDTSLKKGYKIVDHKAGIRPCVPDRKPLIGKHPDHNNVFLFNGMGTKGISLSPYLVGFMTNFILENKKLPLEVDLNRYVNN
jgi:glycine/D-amino acid oxidase-like deaminating enzyme